MQENGVKRIMRRYYSGMVSGVPVPPLPAFPDDFQAEGKSGKTAGLFSFRPGYTCFDSFLIAASIILCLSAVSLPSAMPSGGRNIFIGKGETEAVRNEIREYLFKISVTINREIEKK